MEKLDFQYIMNQIDALAINPIKDFINTLPPESVQLIMGATACFSLIAVITVFLMLRPSRSKKVKVLQNPQDINSFLKKAEPSWILLQQIHMKK